MRDGAFILDVLRQLAAGIPLTLELASCSLLLGALLGLAIAFAALSARRAPRVLAWFYVEVIRSTPLLVLMFLIYYGLGQYAGLRDSVLWPLLRQPYWCALLALTINTSSYTGEIIRGGLLSVPQGALEAGRACGMSRPLLYRRIILPLAIRQALPAYGNEVMSMIKGTSLGSLVTLMEVTGIASAIVSETYRPMAVFIAAGILYFGINFILTRGIMLLEYRLNANLRPPSAGAR
ncbi:ABC transporter permease [Acerihabitans arboris]|uniref:Arginine ABC transporter permease protein ArtM n=1 Tax=Acerihabitans arboris TaxID=2691583 RepID=A0A845SGE5_9GAMM|nr:ABC transporter permease subunit [Acerihabitans arboris]NDL63930.1 ABC transporter permease subunit [Acerihabitans arboris]